MLTVYTRWMSGGIVNLLPTAFEYFEKKKETLKRQSVSKDQHVENNYYGNTSIINGNANSPVITGNNNTVVSNSMMDSYEEKSHESCDNSSDSNRIFISHRSTDKEITDILFDFFIGNRSHKLHILERLDVKFLKTYAVYIKVTLIDLYHITHR